MLDKAVDSTALDAGLTDIADAIRSKGGTKDRLQFPDEFVSAIEDMDVTRWSKPADWPDLDALELPTDRSENVIYLLYDRNCGFDPVSFGVADSSTRITVHKGNVVDGKFVGELVASNVAKYTDTLTDEYTVYRLSGTFDRFFFDNYHAGNGYDVSLQGVVWVRGTAPFLKELGSPYNNREFASIHTQAFELYDVASLTRIVLNSNGFRNMARYRFYLGVDANGDFGGNTLTRTGGGPMFLQSIGAKDEIVIQNANYGNLASDTFSGVTRLRLRNVTANISGNRFQGAIWLKSLVVEDSCSITFDSVYGSFFYCESLMVLDLHPVDFSGATAASNTFSGCKSLKELRLNNTWTFDINLSNAMSLEKDSVTQLFSDLGTIETARTITLPYGMKNYLLTAEEIAVITEKGWTVA